MARVDDRSRRGIRRWRRGTQIKDEPFVLEVGRGGGPHLCTSATSADLSLLRRLGDHLQCGSEGLLRAHDQRNPQMTQKGTD